MRQLQTQHFLLFRLFRDHFLFLTRGQIERVLTLARRSTNKELEWLLKKGYLVRRYRADSFSHFQTPLYFLSKLGWQAVGNPINTYKQYKAEIEGRAERGIDHMLAVYDVLLKFILESDVKRVIGGEDGVWQELIDFGNIPDAWIHFNNDAAFIEVDLHTEWGETLKRKFANYARFKESGGYRNRFPGNSFKVLVVTTTESRIEFMEQLGVSDDIWFCTMKEFLREKLDHEHWFALNGFYALSASKQKEVQQMQ